MTATELRQALIELLVATGPYMTQAAPHENLFNATDLRNFDALAAARGRARHALEEGSR